MINAGWYYVEIGEGRVRFRYSPEQAPAGLYHDPLEIEVKPRNTGQTPALNVQIKFEVILWSPTRLFAATQAISCYRGIARLGNSLAFLQRVPVQVGWTPELAGGIAVAVQGTYEYFDTFGVKYSEEFGLGYTPPVQLMEIEGSEVSNYDPVRVGEWMPLEYAGVGGKFV